MSLQTVEINSVNIAFDKEKRKNFALILINLVIVKVVEIIIST